MKLSLLVVFALHASGVLAAPAARASAPTVKLDNGTFVGTTTGNVNKWLGIPFAQPPYVWHFLSARFTVIFSDLMYCSLGNLRFNLPQPIQPYTGTKTVASYGSACPQQALTLPIVSGLAQEAIDYLANTIFGVVFPSDEDCASCVRFLCYKHAAHPSR
jgi:acetylcholinesterase